MENLKRHFQKNDNDEYTFRSILESIDRLFAEEGAIKKDQWNQHFDVIHKAFETVDLMFKTIDDDDSGEITLSEFKDAFAGLGLGGEGSEMIEKRMSELDFDNDKEITADEFCAGICFWVGFGDDIKD